MVLAERCLSKVLLWDRNFVLGFWNMAWAPCTGGESSSSSEHGQRRNGVGYRAQSLPLSKLRDVMNRQVPPLTEGTFSCLNLPLASTCLNSTIYNIFLLLRMVGQPPSHQVSAIDKLGKSISCSDGCIGFGTVNYWAAARPWLRWWDNKMALLVAPSNSPFLWTSPPGGFWYHWCLTFPTWIPSETFLGFLNLPTP